MWGICDVCLGHTVRAPVSSWTGMEWQSQSVWLAKRGRVCVSGLDPSSVTEPMQCLESFYFQRTALRSSTFFSSLFHMYYFTFLNYWTLINFVAICVCRSNLLILIKNEDVFDLLRCLWIITEKKTLLQVIHKLNCVYLTEWLSINTLLHIFEGGVK